MEKRWSPAEYLADEAADQNQVNVMVSPSKVAAPSYALKLRGTGGAATRKRSAGPRSVMTARSSSA
jgi:hypothetical protein